MLCLFVRWDMSVFCIAACHELGPDSHRLPYKRSDMHICAMFVMLYLEKKIPQPPPESCYINRIGIKWLFWLKKGMVPCKKVATQARRKRVLGTWADSEMYSRVKLQLFIIYTVVRILNKSNQTFSVCLAWQQETAASAKISCRSSTFHNIRTSYP